MGAEDARLARLSVAGDGGDGVHGCFDIAGGRGYGRRQKRRGAMFGVQSRAVADRRFALHNVAAAAAGHM